MSILSLVTVTLKRTEFIIEFNGKSETFTEEVLTYIWPEESQTSKQSCLSCVLSDYRFAARYTSFDLQNDFGFTEQRADEITNELKELTRKVDNLFTLEEIDALIQEV